jgi:hypothetical protein
MIFDPFGVHDVDSKESDLTWLIRPLRGRRKGVSFLARMIFDPFGVHDVDSKESDLTWLIRPLRGPRRWFQGIGSCLTDKTPSGSTTLIPKESYPTNLRGQPWWLRRSHILFTFTIRLPLSDPNGVEYSHFKYTIHFLSFPHYNSYQFSLNSYTLSIFSIAFPFANSTTSVSR